MAIDKNFVIKNGLEVNEDLLYADDDTGRVGIGKTQPGSTLDVVGDVSLTGIASAGLALTTHDGFLSGFTTSVEGFNIGLGATFFSANKSDKKVGINSAQPQYTTDIIGPVSTGTTALYVFGDLEVTGDIRADELFGQISDGGTVGFSTVTATRKFGGPNSELFSIFYVNGVGGNRFEFTRNNEDPISIGFTETKTNPDIFLVKGRKYHFQVNSGGNPFYIKYNANDNTDGQYLDGVQGNGTQVGIVTFEVPYDAPAALFYQASNQAGMGGKINISGVGYTGTVDNIDVLGIATIKDATIEYLNVTGFSTLGGQGAEVTTNFSVTGISTLATVQAGDITVGTAITCPLIVGNATTALAIKIDTDGPVDTQVFPVLVRAGTATSQRPVIDLGLEYNATNDTLKTSTFEGALTGVSTGSDRVLMDSVNSNSRFKVVTSDQSSATYNRPTIDNGDDTQFTYNPSQGTLRVDTVIANVTGTATTATDINIAQTNDAGSHFLVFTDGSGNNSNQRPEVDTNLTYVPSTNVLTAGGFVGRGTTLTDLNASELTSGTVPGDRGVTAGSATASFVEYNGTTRTAGQFDGGTTNPDSTTRLNYNGQLHATGFTGPLTGNASSASQVNVTESDSETAGRLVFVDATGSNQSLLGDNDLTFNASTNLLTVSSGSVNAAGDSNNFGNTSLDATTVESLSVTNNTQSTSNTTGAIICTGGAGIARDLNVGGDITAFATSDERLKDNIEAIPNALLKMKRISGNTFDWNEESGKEGSECGVIAQEIESLGLPGLVETRDNGYKAVRYEKLVPLLIEAIKELTERVQELEK